MKTIESFVSYYISSKFFKRKQSLITKKLITYSYEATSDISYSFKTFFNKKKKILCFVAYHKS